MGGRGSSGSEWCGRPGARRVGKGGGAQHRMTPEEPKRAIWVVRGLDPLPHIHEKILRERKKRESGSGRGKKE